jgi:multidrug resistance efflux pump
VTASAKKLLRVIITLSVACVALVMVFAFWRYYMRSPWTRDGRVRVEVVTIASEVAGKIISVPIMDNQKVTKGQLLYEIDPTTYQLRFAETEAMVQSKEASWILPKRMLIDERG